MVEKSRSFNDTVREVKEFKCYHLAKELRSRNLNRIDYMTIDTEGSEFEIVIDFPWDQFDVRIIQIEQLLPNKFPGQTGKKEGIIDHLQSFGYKLFHEFQVDRGLTTEDLIFARDLDSYLAMTESFVFGNSTIDM